ncbi:hypothetical protein KP509_21G039800 [Ceratopteris richardii]|uniref:Glycosyltransferase 61 catalytic domain-containing protein n=1 Tax=Ceratopteris richardii TaxID=49495 RepID=A0A8T2S956_CERRI|nr:hypothetical protein KP509_21G039800 [Ceratopteris richardii]
MVLSIRLRRSHYLSLDIFKSSGCRKQHHRWAWHTKTSTLFALVICIFISLSAFQWILPTRPPLPELDVIVPCHDSEGYVLEDMGICTDTCGSLCFPRIHGMCFHHSEVTICDGQKPLPQHVVNAFGGLPIHMRFYMEKPRMKVPVKYKACPGWNSSSSKLSDSGSARWIKGLQMVADLTLMPTGRVGPNPHHEAEKIIPAIIFSQLSEFQDSRLFWFADPNDPLMISKWSLGLLDVFSKDLKVEYLQPVAKGDSPICFEDAIVFAGVTNSGYMPNMRTHDWFRNRILEYCNVPAKQANKPVQDVVVIHRPNSTRNIRNYNALQALLETELRVPVKIVVPGPWSFCDQVKLVAEADVILTPHGSQNVNLLVVRPGALVFEVFPLLYYVNWYKHYLHAGQMNLFEVFGTWPVENVSMPFHMRLYALMYGWRECFTVRRCMNYGKSQGIYVNLDHFGSQLHMLLSRCIISVPQSSCVKGVT